MTAKQPLARRVGIMAVQLATIDDAGRMLK
jgi:hypothetical protein